ncbi:MAG: 3-deoxy-manno-octulosonate cytidylyltransferase [Gemmatimonadota bacterium]|nr:3-deoxy-manno-octulosonate cytidylyltransferase [Gemmatimonadota bacterium]
MSDRVLGIVPARIASTRLPRKPLHLLAGRPLIEWVWRRAQALGVFDALLVATDSQEIASVCAGFGATVEMTSAEHPSGTDRVAEVAARAAWSRYDVVVNVQGDEPLVTRATVEGAVRQVSTHGWDVGTCATPLRGPEEWVDPAVVKVVTGDRGRALYFSRAAIPHPREGAPEWGAAPWLRHLGVYAYRRGALEAWVALPPSRLEGVERLEQLRPLEAGIGIGVAVVPEAEGGVDTPEDALRVERRLIQDMESGYV